MFSLLKTMALIVAKYEENDCIYAQDSKTILPHSLFLLNCTWPSFLSHRLETVKHRQKIRVQKVKFLPRIAWTPQHHVV